MVVLSIITRNGARKGLVFRRMLEATLQVPYSSMILVDDSDDDSTSRVVKEFADAHGKELLATRSRLYGYVKATRATGRQTAIDIFLENFSDNVLIQLDDDVILRDGWWNEANGALNDPSIGMFYGATYDVNDLNEAGNVQMDGARLKALLTSFLERGRTNDIALRRSALAGIRGSFGIIPPELHLYEDAWLMRAMMCLGWGIIIGFTGAIQHDPVKLSQAEAGVVNADVDLHYTRVASKYGIIRSVDLLDDILKLPATLAALPILTYRRTRKLGPVKGLKVALAETHVKLLYRYVKVKGALTGSCNKLKYKHQLTKQQ
ncbi:MAG: glycosyltransferase [Caldivirga sp.]